MTGEVEEEGGVGCKHRGCYGGGSVRTFERGVRKAVCVCVCVLWQTLSDLLTAEDVGVRYNSMLFMP